MNDTPIEYLSTRKAAAFLGLSPRTLDRYRVTGQGPVFHKFGTRIRYLRFPGPLPVATIALKYVDRIKAAERFVPRADHGTPARAPETAEPQGELLALPPPAPTIENEPADSDVEATEADASGAPVDNATTQDPETAGAGTDDAEAGQPAGVAPRPAGCDWL